ncbi:MAG: phosphate ABC transporter permease, partial [Xanthomonadales bacterium]|nr:phosphate ABC transporter permease [Xanthomonadales bacterium]
MNAVTPVSGTRVATRSERFHRWRSRKDTGARWLIAVGGVGVIFAVVLIFFYLLWVVFPLFLPATTSLGESRVMPGWADSVPVYSSLEEQQEIGLRSADDGSITFFNLQTGRTVERYDLPLEDGERIALGVEAVEHHGQAALISDRGRAFVFRHLYDTRFDGGVETRKIHPKLEYPYGAEPLLALEARPIGLAYSDSDSGIVVAAVSADGLVRAYIADKSENFLTGEIELDGRTREIRVDFPVTAIAVSGNHRWLYLADRDGRVHRYGLPGLEALQVIPLSEEPITAMATLLGGISILAGDGAGVVHQLFPVRNEANEYRLEPIRQFEPIDGAIRWIFPEERRKGFLALGEGQELGIFHSTAGTLVHTVSLAEQQPLALALSPRSNGLTVEQPGGRLAVMEIRNEHPEVSFSSLWRKVWYENYENPEYVWQSSAATNEFEPKFSLTPLVFGTVKAALYAMLFAIPLALMGAAYTAYFMSPQLRKWVKPGIEIMAALPTVILGFLAGLWFAPWVEEHLAHLFLLLLLIPPGLLAFAWAWHRLEHPLKDSIPDGWEPVLLLPALLLSAAVALWLADPVQAVLFAGDFREWLTNEAGISYDQR